jgi:hypothetical protein
MVFAAAGLCCAATRDGVSATPSATLVESLQTRAQSIAAAYPNRARLQRLGTSAAGHSIDVLVLGEADGHELDRPGFLVVAGLDGDDVVGPQAALAWAETLLARAAREKAAEQRVRASSVYIVFALSPDALSCVDLATRGTCTANARPVDDDLDGLVDEDAGDDLNGDGRITQMRIADGVGTMVLDPTDSRLMLGLDTQSTGAQRWSVYTEGLDDDHDLRFNEDERGGVRIATNFPFEFPWFEKGSGTHPLSEPESYAFAQWMVAHPNIGTAFVFGSADNLSAACLSPEEMPKEGGANESSDAGRRKVEPVTKVNAADQGVFGLAGQEWRQALGLRAATKAGSHRGALIDWLYFHRGMWAFGAPSWSSEIELARQGKLAGGKAECASWRAALPVASTDAKADKNGNSDKKESSSKEAKGEKNEDRRNANERAFLGWLDEQAPASFVAWKPIKHPDFPNRVVEVGGFVAGAKALAPASMREELSKQHANFLDRLFEFLPRVAVEEFTVRALGQGVYDITVVVVNHGTLATTSAHANQQKIAAPIRATIDVSAPQVIGGNRSLVVDALGSGQRYEAHWVVLAKGKTSAKVQITSAFAGHLELSLPLRNAYQSYKSALIEHSASPANGKEKKR